MIFAVPAAVLAVLWTAVSVAGLAVAAYLASAWEEPRPPGDPPAR